MAARNQSFSVEEKTVGPMLVAGIRAKGVYSDSAERFGKLGRAVGRYLDGKPLGLYYDTEYKERDADFESCFPIRKVVEKIGIVVHEIPGGRCVSLVHRGPYSELGRSIARRRRVEAQHRRQVIEVSAHDPSNSSGSALSDTACTTDSVLSRSSPVWLIPPGPRSRMTLSIAPASNVLAVPE